MLGRLSVARTDIVESLCNRIPTRVVLADMNVVEAMELVKNRLAKAPTNAEFLMTMNMG